MFPLQCPVSARRSQSILIVMLVGLLAVILGLNFVAMKVALRSAGPLTIATAGAIAAGASMLILARVTGERGVARGKVLGQVLPIAISIGIVAQLGFAFGLERIDASTGSILISTTPILTALMGWWVLGESTSRKAVVGVLLAFIGTAIMAAIGKNGTNLDPVGIGFLLCAALGWATGLVLMKRVGEEIEPATLVAWQTILSIPVVLFLAWFGEGLKIEWSWLFVGIIIFQGALARGLSFVLQRHIMLRGTTLEASLVAFLTPVSAGLFGVTLLSEIISGREIVGAIAILAGVALVLAPQANGPVNRVDGQHRELGVS